MDFIHLLSFSYGLNAGANFSNLTKDNSFFQQINDNRGHAFGTTTKYPNLF